MGEQVAARYYLDMDFVKRYMHKAHYSGPPRSLLRGEEETQRSARSSEGTT